MHFLIERSINLFTCYASMQMCQLLRKANEEKKGSSWCLTKDTALLATSTAVTPLGVIFYSYLIIKAVHELHNVQHSNLK